MPSDPGILGFQGPSGGLSLRPRTRAPAKFMTEPVEPGRTTMPSSMADPPRKHAPSAPRPRPSDGARGGDVRGAPVSLYLEVTNRCNLECQTCIRTSRRREPPAGPGLAATRRPPDQMEGRERAVLQGIGEPLLNEEIFEIVALLKSRGTRVVFNTNGTLLDADRRRRILASGLDELR